MDFAAHFFHVRKIRARLDCVESFAAPPLPAVVQIDVSPAVLRQSRRHHRARGPQRLVLRDVCAVTIVTIPAHRRRELNVFTHDNAEFLFRRSQGIFRVQNDVNLAGLFQRAGNAPRLGIQFQTARQIVGGEFHRTATGDRHGVEEGRTRTDTKDCLAIDARCRGGFGRENHRHRWRSCGGKRGVGRNVCCPQNARAEK